MRTAQLVAGSAGKACAGACCGASIAEKGDAAAVVCACLAALSAAILRFSAAEVVDCGGTGIISWVVGCGIVM